jgi:hypothetical protein
MLIQRVRRRCIPVRDHERGMWVAEHVVALRATRGHEPQVDAHYASARERIVPRNDSKLAVSAEQQYGLQQLNWARAPPQLRIPRPVVNHSSVVHTIQPQR